MISLYEYLLASSSFVPLYGLFGVVAFAFIFVSDDDTIQVVATILFAIMWALFWTSVIEVLP